jgi:hypothetical protein
MLHRRFLQANSSQSADTFAYSRDTCIDASLESLSIQRILDEETRPGGQLDAMRWRMTSIMNDQFLTATVILCSMVYRKQTKNRLEEVLASLRGARNVWMRTTGSQEAAKAVETINVILAKASKDARAATGDEEDGVPPLGVGDADFEPHLPSSTDGSIDTGQLLLQDLDMRVFKREYSSLVRVSY